MSAEPHQLSIAERPSRLGCCAGRDIHGQSMRFFGRRLQANNVKAGVSFWMVFQEQSGTAIRDDAKLDPSLKGSLDQMPS